MKRIIATLAVAAIIVGALASSAVAGTGKGRGGGSQTAVVAAEIKLDQTAPRYGDAVSFTATYPSMRETPFVWLACSQNGSIVYQSGGVPGGFFPLGGAGVSSAWMSGAAECTATLYYNTYQGQTQTGQVMLATTNFAVAAA